MSISWNQRQPSEEAGLIVGCDEAQEWMLPWWWERYSEHNTLPVTFIDFGLSLEAKAFCEERGQRVDLFLPDSFTPQKEQISTSLRQQWNKIFDWEDDPFWWNKRMRCHQKPFAFLMTPYKHTLWVDVDCEVCADLIPLFERIKSEDTIYIVPKLEEDQRYYENNGIAEPGEVGYNSGVVGFHSGSDLILKWAESTIHDHPFFISDEDLFSRLAFLEKWKVVQLEQCYNWLPHFRGFNPETKINHWLGNSGKFFLSLRMQKIF